MTVDDQTVLCNNTASVEGADVNARTPQYGYKSSVTLPAAAGMNQTYLGDSQGFKSTAGIGMQGEPICAGGGWRPGLCRAPY